MKKFIFKILFLLAVVQTVLYVYIEYFPIYYNSIYNTRWFYFKQIFNREIEIKESKVLFLGDSRLNTDVDVKRISNAWSFSAGGATPIEMYYTLKNYLEIYPAPDTVFISFSPMAFVKAFSFWEYSIRNDYFTSVQFEEILTNYRKYPNDNVLGNFCKMRYLIHRANFITFYQDDLYRNFVFLGKKKNQALIRSFQNEKGIWNYPNLKDSCSELNFETGLKSFTPSLLLDYYFIELIEVCKKKNIFIIIESCPINESSYYRLHAKYIDEYKGYFWDLKLKYPEYIISDSIYFYEDNYFGDESHLNNTGKVKFTNYLLDKYFIYN